MVTPRAPWNVSRRFEPGTSRAEPCAAGRPIQASLITTGAEPAGFPRRTRKPVPDTDARAIWRTVASGATPCTPSIDAAQMPADDPWPAESDTADAGAAAGKETATTAPTAQAARLRRRLCMRHLRGIDGYLRNPPHLHTGTRGRTTLEEIMQQHSELEQRMLERLDDETLRMMEVVLERVSAALADLSAGTTQ
jgi:hypothetical protein